MLRSDLLEGFDELSKQILAFEELARIIAVARFQSFPTGSCLVFLASCSCSRQVETAVNYGPDQPGTWIGGPLRLKPKAQSGFLDGITSHVVAFEDLSRHTHQGLEQWCNDRSEMLM